MTKYLWFKNKLKSLSTKTCVRSTNAKKIMVQKQVANLFIHDDKVLPAKNKLTHLSQSQTISELKKIKREDKYSYINNYMLTKSILCNKKMCKKLKIPRLNIKKILYIYHCLPMY